MRMLLDYVETKTDEMRDFVKILRKEPLDKDETVKDVCIRYLASLSEMQKAISEINKRFGDMTVGESVKRFGTI